ncbi:uncharacterized protein LOC122082201 [Macadamia integrifolia]|uniref:uncharacterized protein LOC122082201 n=1 Tax=Macadamia integrifolia TaxID=60698 RepID=UPI001C500C54|nr:uncharacterized protein LOC122082201 [Macadamia integrifolia]
MAGAQNQMGQLVLRAEAMSRELEASEREKVSLDNERSILLEKVEHLECELALERRECERKLSELKSQMRARLLEAEARGVEKYRVSEAFKEEITNAIAPGYTMGATEVRDWVLGHYPGVSFADTASSLRTTMWRRCHRPPRLPTPTVEAAARKVRSSCKGKSLRPLVVGVRTRRHSLPKTRP